MKNNFSVAVLAVALTSLTITVASAHPPHPYHHYYGGYYGGFFPPVVVISTGDSDDSQNVSMVGHVFRKTGDDSYLFTDGTSTFHLYSENSDLPVGPTIVIGGRFDDNQVDIRKWHYAE